MLRNDFDGQEWHVHQQIVRGLIVPSTKTGHRRKVYIPLWVRQVIKSMPTRIDSPYFFVNEDGGFLKIRGILTGLGLKHISESRYIIGNHIPLDTQEPLNY